MIHTAPADAGIQCGGRVLGISPQERYVMHESALACGARIGDSDEMPVNMTWHIKNSTIAE